MGRRCKKLQLTPDGMANRSDGTDRLYQPTQHPETETFSLAGPVAGGLKTSLTTIRRIADSDLNICILSKGTIDEEVRVPMKVKMHASIPGPSSMASSP
ncbi:hypothetical protein OPV22_016915 [Ensete ventricosum]|uniref:Uncharacterized protein n=1 Tax=Ensete ventricosum TaxID=4639 RepID=A0AAV8QSN8_ENSVE|nr:hypothetical protein OPV22_016915 [Ensete ventricosum]